MFISTIFDLFYYIILVIFVVFFFVYKPNRSKFQLISVSSLVIGIFFSIFFITLQITLSIFNLFNITLILFYPLPFYIISRVYSSKQKKIEITKSTKACFIVSIVLLILSALAFVSYYGFIIIALLSNPF